MEGFKIIKESQFVYVSELLTFVYILLFIIMALFLCLAISEFLDTYYKEALQWLLVVVPLLLFVLVTYYYKAEYKMRYTIVPIEDNYHLDLEKYKIERTDGSIIYIKEK